MTVLQCFRLFFGALYFIILCPIKGAPVMERVIQLHIEKLPEGVYIATSDDVQGLVAQGRTIQEPYNPRSFAFNPAGATATSAARSDRVKNKGVSSGISSNL